jgi:3,4-dihydroxy 2-butanone 4-phosphate synthase / GTP cyclohydrolase II
VERLSEQRVQTPFGEFRLYTYQDRVSLEVHLALATGRLDGSPAPLVRVHLPETLRDLLQLNGGGRAWTLQAALERIAQDGNGVVVVLRHQESAAELGDALRSLAGATPVLEAAPRGEGAVLRTFGIGAQILKDLGVSRMRVLSAPKQMLGISAFGLEVEGYVGAEG